MRELEKLVEELNSMYCSKTKNHLVIRNYAGHVQVCLTGKTCEIGLKTTYFGITNGFQVPIYALRNLQECEKYGWLRSVIKRYERKK